MINKLKIGVLVTKKNVFIGIAQDGIASLFEKRLGLPEISQGNIGKLLNSSAEELGLKLSDFEKLNYFSEDISKSKYIEAELKELSKENSIEFNKLKNSSWILDSNWIYKKEEVEDEKIDYSKPVYPYLTAISTDSSTDLIVSSDPSDTKLVGSFADLNPQDLIKGIKTVLEIETNDIQNLLEIGDPTVLDFEYKVEPSFDLNIKDIIEPLSNHYSQEKRNYSELESGLKSELMKNLKADLLVSFYDKLFDYINIKLFGVADSFDIKTINLVGELWLNKRFQEKIIRMAQNAEFKIKFPHKDYPLPLGSLVAAYN